MFKKRKNWTKVEFSPSDVNKYQLMFWSASRSVCQSVQSRPFAGFFWGKMKNFELVLHCPSSILKAKSDTNGISVIHFISPEEPSRVYQIRLTLMSIHINNLQSIFVELQERKSERLYFVHFMPFMRIRFIPACRKEFLGIKSYSLSSLMTWDKHFKLEWYWQAYF